MKTPKMTIDDFIWCGRLAAYSTLPTQLKAAVDVQIAIVRQRFSTDEQRNEAFWTITEILEGNPDEPAKEVHPLDYKNSPDR